MRFGNSTAAAVCVLAAGLALGGCEAASSSGSSGGSAVTPAANADSSAQAGSASSAAASSPGTRAGTAHGTCQPGNLSFALGARTSGSRSQATQTVDLTNQGSSACTMDGFAGVHLDGVARGQQDYTWSLARRSGGYSKVRLQPGGTAHFDVVYLPTSSGNINSITVTKMVITPPNDHTQAELAWSPFVLLQDGATHPGTYISPIVSGS